MIVEGRVISQQKSLYGVDTARGVVEATVRGLLKRGNRQPIAGDLVDVEIIGENPGMRGIVRAVKPRKNLLRRPSIANVDQVLVIVTAREPRIEPEMIDRLLACVEALELTAWLLFNKTDLLSTAERQRQIETIALYESIGYGCIEVSAATGQGVDGILSLCRGSVVTLAGPSGVGKTSLLNRIFPSLNLPTGAVSQRTERGTHPPRQHPCSRWQPTRIWPIRPISRESNHPISTRVTWPCSSLRCVLAWEDVASTIAPTGTSRDALSATTSKRVRLRCGAMRATVRFLRRLTSALEGGRRPATSRSTSETRRQTRTPAGPRSVFHPPPKSLPAR